MEVVTTKAQEQYAKLTKQLYSAPLQLIDNEQLVCHLYQKNQGFISIFQSKTQLQQYCIGNFQCVENQSAASQLLSAATDKIKELGGQKVYGPMHGNTFFPYRFTLSDSIGNTKANHSLAKPEDFFTSEMIHKPYYPKFWEEFGFYKTQNYSSFTSLIPETVAPSIQHFERKNLRDISPKQVLQDLYEFSLQVFHDNVLFEPISFELFREIYETYLPFLQSPLCQLVYDKKKIVGLFFAFPDVNRENTVIVKTLARLPEDDYRGLATQMSHQFIFDAYQMGYREQIHAYFHEGNRSRFISEKFGGKPFKHHVLYALDI